jgi:hypothetical protein
VRASEPRECRRWAFSSFTSADHAAAASVDLSERAWAAKRAKSDGVAGSGEEEVARAEMLDIERLRTCLCGEGRPRDGRSSVGLEAGGDLSPGGELHLLGRWFGLAMVVGVVSPDADRSDERDESCQDFGF